MEKLNNIANSYVKGISQFCDPLYIVLFGSSVNGITNGDLNILSVVRKTTTDLINNISDFTVKFNNDHNIPNKFQIPYDKKLVYSNNDIEQILAWQGFDYKYQKFLLSPIRNAPDFLSGDMMRYRLFLNALTTQNRLLFWEKKAFEMLKKACWETMFRIIVSQFKGNKMFSKGDICDLMLQSSFDWSRWHEYLWYKEEQMNFLLQEIEKILNILVVEQKIYWFQWQYKINEDWMSNFINDYQRSKQKNKILGESVKDQKEKYRVDFMTNKNPEKLNLLKRNFLVQVEDIFNYPDYTNLDINKAISNFLWLGVEEVSISQWSLDAIYNIPKCVNAKSGILIEPTYRWYEASLSNSALPYHRIFLNKNFNLDMKQLNTIIKEHTLVFICNPNNPTGTYLTNDALLSLVQNHPWAHFVIDETHLLFNRNFNELSFKQYIQLLENITVVFSFSKFFNVPGIRVWAIASNPLIINKFKTINVPYYINNISKTILMQGLVDIEFITNSRKYLEREKERFFVRLQEIDYLKVLYNEYANFLMLQIIDPKISWKKIERLLQNQGIDIKSCEWLYNGLEWDRIRVSINTKENNDLLYNILNNKTNIVKHCTY